MQLLISIWAALIHALEETLFFFNSYIQYFGVSIILLTAAIRILILPLTIRQTSSMQQLQKIQPKLKKLQEKYKGKKEKLSQEMLKLYSEHKVNPLGGCLPMLLQLPIFIALFRMLSDQKSRTFKALAKAEFLWLNSLNKPDPTLILVLLVVGTQYYSQKMMGSADPQQQRMMNIMLVVLGFFAWRFPAGVLLYWVTTNVLTIAQQYLTTRFAPEQQKG